LPAQELLSPTSSSRERHAVNVGENRKGEKEQMARNRKSGLYPNLINSALRKQYNLPLRSEKHNNYLDLCVDTKQTVLLKNPDWQVIYGRRGTGKTFLLGVLSEEVHQQLDQLRILALRITAQDCIVSPTGRAVDDKSRALGYFQTFIELLADRLIQSVEQLIGRPKFLDSITGGRRRRIEKIEEIALDILSLSQAGFPVAAFANQTQSLQTLSTVRNTATIDATVNASISPLSPTLKAGVNAQAQAKEEHQATQARSVDSGAVPRFARVRQKLLELLDLMDIRHLNILIDEWSALDPTAVTAVQPEFAELLKRTFAGTGKISVKIATNRYQTRFSNRAAGREYRGLELNADIFEAANLDHILMTEDELWSFYEMLLYKRLLFCEPKLHVFDPYNTGHPDEQFILSLFRDPRAFTELVKGASGIPRDFLLIFNELSRHFDFSATPTWEAAEVQRCIREKSAVKQEDIEYRSETDQLLTRCIREIVLSTASRLFFIARADRDSLNAAVEELLEKRLIHGYPKTHLTPEIRSHHDGFLIDYGLWLDWQYSTHHAKTQEEYTPLLSLEQVEQLTIDTSVIDRQLLTCQYCHAAFAKDARPYVLRGLCPECFMLACEHRPSATAPARFAA
jgi:hypothetical protein